MKELVDVGSLSHRSGSPLNAVGDPIAMDKAQADLDQEQLALLQQCPVSGPRLTLYQELAVGTAPKAWPQGLDDDSLTTAASGVGHSVLPVLRLAGDLLLLKSLVGAAPPCLGQKPAGGGG